MAYDDLYRHAEGYVGQLLYFAHVEVLDAEGMLLPHGHLFGEASATLIGQDYLDLVGYSGERLRHGDVLEVTGWMLGLTDVVVYGQIPSIRIVSTMRLPAATP